MENRETLLREAYDRSTLRLQAQEQIALAADQRGLVGAGLAFAAAGLSYDNPDNASLFTIAYLISFVVSGIIALFSSFPGSHYTAGSKAHEMREVIEAELPLDKVLKQLCDYNDEYIDINDGYAARRSLFFKLSLYFFILGGILLLIEPLISAIPEEFIR